MATAVANLEGGAAIRLLVGEGSITIKLQEPISLGHKFSITQIEDGSAYN